MKSMLKAFYAKPLTIYLVMALIAISAFAGSADAMFIAAAPSESTARMPQQYSDRAADLAKVQAALESRIVRQKLSDYGLSPTETLARVNSLSDQQLHELATHTNSIQAGSDAAGTLFGLLIAALLVVVLIYLLQHRIEVR